MQASIHAYSLVKGERENPRSKLALWGRNGGSHPLLSSPKGCGAPRLPSLASLLEFSSYGELQPSSPSLDGSSKLPRAPLETV